MLINQNPVDHWLTARKAIVAHLTADAPIAGLVSAEKIWGESPPASIKWPFVRIGFPITTPWSAYGKRGSQHRFSIHAFDKSSDTGNVSNIASAIVARMETFVIPTLDLVDRQWIGTNMVRDTDEASAFHAIIDFDIIAVLTE